MADGAEQEAVLCCFMSFKEIIPEEEGGLCSQEISNPIDQPQVCWQQEKRPPYLGALQQQAVPWRSQAGAVKATWEQADMAQVRQERE